MNTEREPWWYFHWQNLNEKPGDRLGSPLRYGRAWLRIGRGIVNWEWVLGRFDFGWRFCVTQSEEIGFHFRLAVPLFTLYVTIGDFAPVARLARWLLRNEGYKDLDTSWSVHDWALWWNVWRDASSWDSKTPRWRNGSFHFDDFFLGRTKYVNRVLSEHAVKIALPEASYDATVKLEEAMWKRPRWFARRVLCADVNIPNGIPVPGKGENSYDCGDDAIYGLRCHVSTVEQAIAETVKSVLRSRRKNGGSVDWKPEVADVGA